jgi:hypothetical protein
MPSTWKYLEESFGLNQQMLNDPLIAVKIQREITLKRPPEFSYLSSYAPMSQKRRQQAESEHNHHFCTSTFTYKSAKALEDRYCDDRCERIQRKLTVLEAIDRETRVKFQYEIDNEPTTHVLFIGNSNPNKPAGYYNVKKSMIRFRNECLERNNKDYAWGRSLASTYPVKLNRKRWADTDGDWRRQPARVKCKYGKRSQHIDRLAAFYLRTGLWIPIDWSNYKTEGLKIVMPSQDFFKKMVEADKEYTDELSKFSK